jgi:hypothetical protein
MSNQIHLIRVESIDRLDAVVNELPKYKKLFEKLITNFTVDDILRLMNIIDKDKDFKRSIHYRRYNRYFDEIEELIHQYV